MRHAEMEGKIKPACQRHWAKKTLSVPDIPILLEPGADDGLQLMGGENDGSHHHHKAMPDSSINGFLPSSLLHIDIWRCGKDS